MNVAKQITAVNGFLPTHLMRPIDEECILSERPYPNGIDCVWLASDSKGYLAAFITAGAGAVPRNALRYGQVPVEDIEGLLRDLPKVSTARVLVSVERPDDFVDLAERGLFVYDWTDIHRTARNAIGTYELVAVPTDPTQVHALTDNLAAMARAVKFMDVSFVDEVHLDVRRHIDCREGR